MDDTVFNGLIAIEYQKREIIHVKKSIGICRIKINNEPGPKKKNSDFQ